MPARYHNVQGGNEYARVTFRMDGKQADDIEKVMEICGYETLSDVIRAAISQFIELNSELDGKVKMQIDLPKKLESDFNEYEKNTAKGIRKAVKDYIAKRQHLLDEKIRDQQKPKYGQNAQQ